MRKKLKMAQQDEVEFLLKEDVDLQQRVLFLFGDIDDVMYRKVLLWFHNFAHNSSTEDVTVHLSSEGGEVDAALAIYDVISSAVFPVTIVGGCRVWSAACIILQAADTRLLTKHCSFMHHAGSESISEDITANVERRFAWYRKQQTVVEDIMLEKIQKVHPGYLRGNWHKKDILDNYLTADEAVGWGLADKVLE
jgi:ATP-dependent protease ClpP protease subunit